MQRCDTWMWTSEICKGGDQTQARMQTRAQIQALMSHVPGICGLRQRRMRAGICDGKKCPIASTLQFHGVSANGASPASSVWSCTGAQRLIFSTR